MNVSEVKLMRRKNLGNYEHIEAQATVALVEGEDRNEAVEMAKETVMMCLGDKKPTKTVQTKTSTNAKEEEAPKEEEEKKPGKTSKKVTKKAPSKKQATKTDVLNALRKYAKEKDSREQAQAVLKDVTGKDSLAEVDKKDYNKLVKALKV